MTDKSLALDEALYKYFQAVSLQESTVLTKLRAETAKLPMSIMQIAPEQGQFMALLVKLIGAKKALEIGVFTGYSALVVALALPDDGKIIACDKDERYTNMAKPYWEEAGVSHKIDLRIAPALETLAELIATGQENTFDFAFIDADKGNYSNYYEQALKLVRPGGLIAIDNVLWSGRVADPEDTDKRTIAIREFNQKLYQDKRVDISLVPIADGLTLAMKLNYI
ncbi:O-methyltransferase MdmC [Hyella patelloides LEGE 07179]|uniref:O-methyltransferase MdmC n=1 Tax=Hyella patelloides LEGE 07179 TaxID=945734 RepID=A0A563VNH9_9CYAN|nr:class I SAM-dependent methyltransferase [Hyella patelloides]VEP12979.1 O-methyltransferase MdmC [Hyella patelloides LEGE 07179]